MLDIDLNQQRIYHMTPEIRKNHKSIHLQRITQRISLLKHQLKKQKDQTFLDQIHLKQISTIGEKFQNRLIDGLEKCHQLRQGDLKTQKTLLENNFATQKQTQNFASNLNLYNQDRLNSKPHFNTQISTELPFSIIHSPELLVRKQEKTNPQKIPPQQPSKKPLITGTKNTTPKEKNTHNYLKETFLTSIIFILFTLVLHQILQIF